MITSDLRPLAPPPVKAATWLLTDVLPRGELVVLEGAAGVGKTLLACAWTAHISHESTAPLTLLTASPASSDTLATHLARQRPSYDRLHEFAWIALPDEKKKPAADEALHQVETHLQQHRPALLVIESLEEALGTLAGEPERRLRWFWSELVCAARRWNTTILVLARPQGRRGAARVARTAAEAAKAVFTLAWHPTDPAYRVLTRTRDLLAPAGAQWQVAINPDGHVDWTPAGDDTVAPAPGVAPWKVDTRRCDVPAAVRAIEQLLEHPMPAPVLRDLVRRQGHSVHAFKTAMRIVDAEYKRFGSVWMYYPGPELAVLQELRRQRQGSKPTPQAPSPPEASPPTPPDTPTSRVEAKLDAAREVFAAEVGAEAAEHFYATGEPKEVRARFERIFGEMDRALPPDERAALDEMTRRAERQQVHRDAERRRAERAPCCARAHPNNT